MVFPSDTFLAWPHRFSFHACTRQGSVNESVGHHADSVPLIQVSRLAGVRDFVLPRGPQSSLFKSVSDISNSFICFYPLNSKSPMIHVVLSLKQLLLNPFGFLVLPVGEPGAGKWSAPPAAMCGI